MKRRQAPPSPHQEMVRRVADIIRTASEQYAELGGRPFGASAPGEPDPPGWLAKGSPYHPAAVIRACVAAGGDADSILEAIATDPRLKEIRAAMARHTPRHHVGKFEADQVDYTAALASYLKKYPQAAATGSETTWPRSASSE